MAGKHLVRRDGIAIDIIGFDINVAVAGMLDAVNYDEAVRRFLADGGGNGFDINRNAGDRRGLDDGRNANLGCNLITVGSGIDASCFIVMGHQNMGPAGHFGPACHGAARGGMFERAAQHDAAGFRAQCRGPDQAEQHLGSAFADEDLACGRIEEVAHVGLALGDGRHQSAGSRVVAALVVGIGGIGGGGFRHGFQRQGAAGILKEHARAVKGAGVDMGETLADFVHQLGSKGGHEISLIGC